MFGSFELLYFSEQQMQVRDALVKEVKTKGEHHEIDMLHWLSRTALELIGQGGLGYSFENFEDDTLEHEYTRAVKDFL